MGLRGARVLLAEDDEGVRFAVSKTLRRQGCSVVETSDGEAALRHLQQERVDLLVTDLGLPSLSGDELARRCADLHPEAAIIIATGSHARPLQGVGGKTEILSKPFSMALLVERASSLLAEAPTNSS